MLLTAIYVINTFIALGVVYAAIDPAGCQSLLERLGLWPLVERLDQHGMRHILAFIGKLLVLAGVLLAVSVMLGRHSTSWLLPSGQSVFFGVIAWLVAALGDEKRT